MMKYLLIGSIMFLFGAVIELEKRTILDGKVELLLPKDFKPMTSEMLDFKYRGANRPKLVFTNEDATVNIAFSLLPNDASASQIEGFKDAIKNSYQKSFPDAAWVDDGIKMINGNSVIDRNLQLYGEINGRLERSR